MKPVASSPSALPTTPASQDAAPDWLSLAEYLWCLEHRQHIFKPLPARSESMAPDLPPPPAPGPFLPEKPPAPALQPDVPPSQVTPPPPEDGSHKLSVKPDLHATGLDTPFTQASPVPIGAPILLPGQRDLARALRPLARRVRHGRLELDITATVEKTAAHGGLFQPQMRRASRRWLEVELVVDTGDSVAFWQGLAADVERILSLTGAFRRVRRWNLRAGSDCWGLESAVGLPVQAAYIACKHTARCILILSDTLDELWFQPQATELLSTLAAHSPTVLLHLLPPRLWERSGLGDGSLARISSPIRGSSNHSWRATSPAGNYPLPPGLPMPCLNFEAAHFARLAGLLTGAKNNSLQGLLLSDRERRDTADENTGPAAATGSQIASNPADTVDAFFSLASREAASIACYLAAAPLIPPVMRMVQEVFAKNTCHWHLTEVLCGGLVEQSPHLGEIEGMMCYAWLPGVRAQLLRRSPVSETRQVWRRVGEWLAVQQSPSLRQFAALLQHPQGSFQTDLAHDHFFAEVTAEVWQTWGGEWTAQGRQLAHRLNIKPEEDSDPPSKPPKPPNRAFADIRILWVDDNPSGNSQHSTALQAEGAEIIFALNTEAALLSLIELRFDAIISDLNRGQENRAGLELLRSVRSRGMAIPFAIYSKIASSVTKQALDLGALICSKSFRNVRRALLDALRPKAEVYLDTLQIRRLKNALQKRGIRDAVSKKLAENPLAEEWAEVWATAQNEEEFFQLGIDLVAAVANTGYHQIFDFRQGELNLLASKIDSGRTTYTQAVLGSLIGSCARKAKTVYAPDVKFNPNYIASELTTRSELAIPLLSPDSTPAKALAVINIESPEQDRFGRREIQWLEGFASSMAQALVRLAEHGEADETVQKWTRQVTALSPDARGIFAVRCALRIHSVVGDTRKRARMKTFLNLAESGLRRGAFWSGKSHREDLIFSEAFTVVKKAQRRQSNVKRDFNDIAIDVSALAVQFAVMAKGQMPHEGSAATLIRALILAIHQLPRRPRDGDWTRHHHRAVAVDLDLLAVRPPKRLEDSGFLWPAEHPGSARKQQPDKWVWVTSLGSLPSDHRLGRELGAMLAADGFGLISPFLSWSRKDDPVLEAFEQRIHLEHQDSSLFLTYSSEEHWDQGTARPPDSFIFLPSSGNPEAIIQTARRLGKPLLPIPDSGTRVTLMHEEMLRQWEQRPITGITREQFQSLAVPAPASLDHMMTLLPKVDAWQPVQTAAGKAVWLIRADTKADTKVSSSKGCAVLVALRRKSSDGSSGSLELRLVTVKHLLRVDPIHGFYSRNIIAWEPGVEYTEANAVPLTIDFQLTREEYLNDLVFLKLSHESERYTPSRILSESSCQPVLTQMTVIGYPDWRGAGRKWYENIVTPSPHSGWDFVGVNKSTGHGYLKHPDPEESGSSGAGVFYGSAYAGIYLGRHAYEHIFLTVNTLRSWCNKRGYELVDDPAASPLAGARILWVDDYPDNNIREHHLLNQEGAVVMQALSSSDAFSLLERHPFDAIISDLGRKDDGMFAGLDLLKKLNQLGISVPFAIYADGRVKSVKEWALKLGAIACTSSFEEVHEPLLKALAKQRSLSAYLINQLGAETERAHKLGRRAQIYSFSSGQAREVQRFIQDHPISDEADLTLLHLNDLELDYTRRITEANVQKYGRKTGLNWIMQPMSHVLQQSSRSTEVGTYDLVCYSGLFNHLTDIQCRQLLAISYVMLAPGGLLIATTVRQNSTESPVKSPLRNRNEAQLRNLVPGIIPPENIQVITDATGMNLYLEVRKPGSAPAPKRVFPAPSPK